MSEYWPTDPFSQLAFNAVAQKQAAAGCVTNKQNKGKINKLITEERKFHSDR